MCNKQFLNISEYFKYNIILWAHSTNNVALVASYSQFLPKLYSTLHYLALLISLSLWLPDIQVLYQITLTCLPSQMCNKQFLNISEYFKYNIILWAHSTNNVALVASYSQFLPKLYSTLHYLALLISLSLWLPDIQVLYQITLTCLPSQMLLHGKEENVTAYDMPYLFATSSFKPSTLPQHIIHSRVLVIYLYTNIYM